MIYATIQDLIDRFGERELIELTDPDNAAVVPDKAERALADAHALANGLLALVYRLPLSGCVKPAPVPGNPRATETVPPPQLARIVCDVARYYLYDDLAPEAEVARRFRQAQSELKAISEGKAHLMCPWGGEPGVPLSGSAAGECETRFSFSPRSVNDARIGDYK